MKSVLTGVNRQMIFQTNFVCVGFVTVFTFVPFAFVPSHMCFEISITVKTFSTDLTVIAELSCV